MQIYVHKNNQQLGPFDEGSVNDKLRSGVFDGTEMAIRQGESTWTPLRQMFPNAGPAVAAAPFAAPPPIHAAPPVQTPPPASAAPIYRKTVLQKIIFGLAFLGFVGLLVFAVMLMQSVGPSGDLVADLSNMAWRVAARNGAIAAFVGGFFTFIAFALTFKRKIIRSNGLRIALRAMFAFILLVGMGVFLFGAFSYLNYSPEYRPKSDSSNEMLKALYDGEDAVGPTGIALLYFPIGAGIALLGLSGILMAKRGREENL